MAPTLGAKPACEDCEALVTAFSGAMLGAVKGAVKAAERSRG